MLVKENGKNVGRTVKLEIRIHQLTSEKKKDGKKKHGGEKRLTDKYNIKKEKREEKAIIRF